MRFIVFVSSLIAFSSLFGQVGTQINFDRTGNFSDHVIRINWSEQEKSQWESDNRDRLDIMALRTDIPSASLPVSKYLTTTYSFELQDPSFVEMLVEIEFMPIGEFLNIKELSSGRTLFSSINEGSKKILIPAFNSADVIMEWNGSSPGVYNGIFTIKSFYKHKDISERGGRTIGFGTALDCHPNAACKQDSILKLISNCAVRIRMVMDEGIGWCTGSFVNNVRKDKTPYILTAHHCTFEYTPQYDLWRFDLEYKSDSCVNPASEPQVFSITGCEKKAGGQASDFLLLLLNEDPPANHKVTFAGWNRDDVVTPDTTYLVHHPNADIRKLSTCSNKAVVHPNQIGWSEGYTTPANHHFRFKFTEGGHQPGSSGGPVFNQDGYLVAQLHGGSDGCENDNTAFTGRFSKSWNLGTTSAERLKDWLDPDNTGAISIPSLENLPETDLTDISGIIVDPEGNPIRNVKLTISGAITDTTITNSEGEFIFSGINRNGQYHLVPEKNDNQTNGLNAFDLISIQKHLLAKDTFDFTWQHIAADATNNNTISVGDILVLLRLLLGKISYLPSSPSWRFEPPFVDINTIPTGETLRVQMQGIKIGDVDGTADPSQ